MANTCIVSGNIKDATNTDLTSANVEARPIIADIITAENIVISKTPVSVLSDVNGDFSITLIRSVEYDGDGTYIFTISPTEGGAFKFLDVIVPDAATANFEDIVN